MVQRKPQCKPYRKLLSLALILTAFTLSAAALPPDSTAPGFTGKDSTGAQQTLAQYRGKYVVLEWANQGCPYEQKHYRSGNMEALCRSSGRPKESSGSPSSPPPLGRGRATSPPIRKNDYLKTMHAVPTAAILDPTSAIARLYQAKTTPHMFVHRPHRQDHLPGSNRRPTHP